MDSAQVLAAPKLPPKPVPTPRGTERGEEDKFLPPSSDLSVKEIIAALLKGADHSEAAITSCSRQVGNPAFSREFVAAGGLAPLLNALLEVPITQGRGVTGNVLRSLTHILEEKWGHASLKCLAEAGQLTHQLYACLLRCVQSETVLTVARALHVLSFMTAPDIANKATIKASLVAVAAEDGRKVCACLRPAFVGVALLDANMNGLIVLRNLLSLDSGYMRLLEEAQVAKALFPLCENEALVSSLVEFQLLQVKCWRERTQQAVTMDNPDHLALLERLWNTVGTVGKPFPGRSSPAWKMMGFQSDSPARDFRDMGILGLEHLVSYCESCPTEARLIFDTQAKADAEMYYPVATAGVIVSALLLTSLESVLKGGDLVPVALSSPDVLAKMWIIVFRHVDTVFVERKMQYLQFTELSKNVAQHVVEALRDAPLTLDDFAASLRSIHGGGGAGSPFVKSQKKMRSLSGGQRHHNRSQSDSAKQANLVINTDRGKEDSLRPMSMDYQTSSSGNLSSSPALATSAASGAGAALNVTGTSSGGKSAPKPAPPSNKMPRNNRGTKAIGKRLRKAAAQGDAKKVIEALSGGDVIAIVNDPDPVTHTTALHMACLGGSSDCLTLLLGAGAALESTSTTYGSPLHCAAQNGHTLLCKELLEAGAKINSTSAPFGRTPLATACAEQRESVVRLLVARGADVGIVDADGRTAADLWTGDPTFGRDVLGASPTNRFTLNLTPTGQMADAPFPGVPVFQISSARRSVVREKGHVDEVVPTLPTSAIPTAVPMQASSPQRAASPPVASSPPDSIPDIHDVRLLRQENAEMKKTIALLVTSLATLQGRVEVLETELFSKK